MTPEQREAATLAAYRRLLAPEDPEARMIWADLAIVCNAGVTSHVPGDPYTTARNEGMRAVFLHMAGKVGLPLWSTTEEP